MDGGSEPMLMEGLEFRPSAIHGMGVFANRELAPETPVIEYLGQKITKAESLIRCERGNEFIFSLNETLDLDGNAVWNPAKFINHSCEPNCRAELDEVEGRIWIISLRRILPGEELTFDYGYDLEDYRQHPCRCGAAACVGFMVAEDYRAEISLARRASDQARCK